jgi:hypothetical protein
MTRVEGWNWAVMGLTAAGLLFGLFFAILHHMA